MNAVNSLINHTVGALTLALATSAQQRSKSYNTLMKSVQRCVAVELHNKVEYSTFIVIAISTCALDIAKNLR